MRKALETFPALISREGWIEDTSIGRRLRVQLRRMERELLSRGPEERRIPILLFSTAQHCRNQQFVLRPSKPCNRKIMGQQDRRRFQVLVQGTETDYSHSETREGIGRSYRETWNHIEISWREEWPNSLSASTLLETGLETP